MLKVDTIIANLVYISIFYSMCGDNKHLENYSTHRLMKSPTFDQYLAEKTVHMKR